MANTLYALTLSWMTFLAPQRDHTELASAVATVASSEVEAALMTAVAFRESSLRNNITGDGGHSVCAFQIFDGPRSYLSDPLACAKRAAIMLRASAAVDPKYPVSFYARGPRYKSEEARRISLDRTQLAAKLLRYTHGKN